MWVINRNGQFRTKSFSESNESVIKATQTTSIKINFQVVNVYPYSVTLIFVFIQSFLLVGLRQWRRASEEYVPLKMLLYLLQLLFSSPQPSGRDDVLLPLLY